MQSIVFVLALLVAASLPAAGQGTSPFIADFLGQIEYVEGQILSLADAVPADKYGWRPGEGVRSIGEVYRHIEGGNYLLVQLMGTQPPADAGFTMDMKKWDTGVTDKAKIAAGVKASLAHVKAAAGKMTEADLAMKVDFFGNQVTKRSALMSVLSHLHEHLGQSIAYARMNGVVPPWTAAEMARESKSGK